MDLLFLFNDIEPPSTINLVSILILMDLLFLSATAVSEETAETIVKQQKSKRKSTAINFRNSATIEFRVFRGTMNTNTLIANIQLVQLLADIALTNISIAKILDFSFSDLVSEMKKCEYTELIAYCEKKELM